MSSTDHSIEQTFERVRRFRVWIFLGTFLAMLGALAVSLTTSRYSANATLLVKRADTNVLQALSGPSASYGFGLGMRDSYLEKFLVYMNSKNFFDAAAADIYQDAEFSKIRKSLMRPRFASLKEQLNKVWPGLTNYRGGIQSVDDLSRAIAASARIGRGESNTIYISVTAIDRNTAAILANAVADAAVKNTIKAELKEIDEAKAYVLSKVDEIGLRLDQVRAEMTELGSRKGPRLTPMTSASFGPVSASSSERLEGEIQQTKLKIEANRKAIDRLVVKAKARRNGLTSQEAGDASGLARSLSKQVSALKARRSALIAQGMSPTSRAVQDVDQELTETIQQLKDLPEDSVLGDDSDDVPAEEMIRTLEIENDALADYLASAKKMLKEAMADQGPNTERQQRYTTLVKRTEVEHLLRAELSKQLFALDVQRISLRNKISILETANGIDTTRSPPVTSLAFLGAVIGAVLATFLCLAIERHDPTVLGRRDLEVFNLKDLGAIPAVGLRRGLRIPSLGNLYGPTAFNSPTEYSLFWMGMKYIRTRLLRIMSTLGSGSKVISVHSAMPAEGKTIVAFSLAEVLASTGGRVIFLDADVLGSRIREVLDADPRKGFVAVLAGEVTIDQAILKSVKKGLDLLPAGIRSIESTDLLVSRFNAVLEELKARYDYVVVDTPPANLVPDSAIIAATSDLVTFVVACNQTKLREVDEAVRNLEQATSKPLHLLLNRVRKMQSNKQRYNVAYSMAAAEARLPEPPKKQAS